MLKKAIRYLPALLFCGFIGVMMLLWLVLPKESFSMQEKRELESFPELNAETMLNGSFQKGLDTYLTDHVPVRSFFVGLNADYDLISGRNGANGIYYGAQDYLFPKPSVGAFLEKNIGLVKDYADESDIPVYVSILPSSGWVNDNLLPPVHEEYSDGDIIAQIKNGIGDNACFVDACSLFRSNADKKQLYYRTDHHWTSEGAYLYYCELSKAMGFTPVPEQSFDKESISDFYGTSFAKAALWFVQPDTIELWHNKQQPEGSVHIRVQDHLTEREEDQQSDSYFFRSQLKNDDKYPVFLDGNHCMERIVNDNVKDGTLVVVKDSYGHTLVPFLSQHYHTVIMLDPRYFEVDISAICEKEKADAVLILYSLQNFSEGNELSKTLF